ncbi:UvrD-helicase domain-containing protein [Flavobacterium foetidum]|uniref:UvrD-helicase domain-containing protein n=1 Tax=Flavobacterium foetidum TaxID=2026681 RepID=UPI001075513E|nr:UvrD-helicase domain-containing protein [Flavobacterium foetidum]KAF2514645.1 UvrD-helicase domain-containing protein [Flavobacterium foetidum]
MQSPSFSIYDASAGSGKTYTLVKEYLRIILSSKQKDAYRNILAITFTNKAVHEMKSRIVGSLSEFAKDDPSPKAVQLMEDLARETNLSLIQLKTKSQEIIKHLIHNYAAFDISTIDKFTHRVIRAFAHDLNLPMTFEVTLDTENLLVEAVDAIIAQAGEDETLTKLLIDFTMEKTDDDKSWDVSREILETGRLVLNENNRNEILHFQDKSISEFIEIKAKMLQLCKELESQNSESACEALSLIEKNGIDLKSFSRGTFPNHLESIRDGKFNPKNKMFHEFDDIAINKTAKDRALIENIIPDLLKILEGVYKNFEKRDFYKAFLKNITPLSLLNTVSNELAKIQSEQNILSISEFNAIIHREIQEQPAPFIYERLGERYRHFFIDEFQDTSEMQWNNLIPLIHNSLSGQDDAGNKGTLMIVGDPKQSIYRWRGGKAEQFIELGKEDFEFFHHEKELRHLDTNYRSYSQVIDFNNAFFKLISSEFENLDYKDLYENHSFQNSNSKKGGYVNLSFLPIIEKEDGVDEEDAIEKSDLYVLAVLNTIQKVVKQGFEYRDIVILTRKRDQGVLVANYLTEQNIPIISSETLMIQNAAEVRLIVYLLRYLNNNADLESKAYFLHFLAFNKEVEMPVHDFIAHGMAYKSEADFEQWLLSCDVSFCFSDVRKKSLYEAVELIISRFLNVSERNAYVQFFMDIVLERDIKNQAGIADFLNYWEKNSHKFSIPSPEGNNAVQIMTIHKSKGLEFPVVIMPFAEEDYSRKPKDKLWLDAEEESLGIPKALIDNSSAVENFGESASAIFNLKKQEELLDNINVLYVALTRAEEQLYVISQAMKERKDGELPNNMASFFIKYLMHEKIFETEKLEYEFGSNTRLSQPEKVVDTIKTIEAVEEVLDPKNIKIAQREALMWGTHQQEAISYGNIVHEILAFVKDKSDVDLAIAKAMENGLITFDQVQKVNQTLLEIVNHPELIDCFNGNLKVLNEQTIVQKAGKILKPDRIVLNQNKEAFLIDYKTGAVNPKYKQQIQEYQDAIEDLGYKVLKRALVYIGTDIDVVNL